MLYQTVSQRNWAHTALDSIPQNVSEFYAIKISYGVKYLETRGRTRQRWNNKKKPIKDALVFFRMPCANAPARPYHIVCIL